MKYMLGYRVFVRVRIGLCSIAMGRICEYGAYYKIVVTQMNFMRIGLIRARAVSLHVYLVEGACRAQKYLEHVQQCTRGHYTYQPRDKDAETKNEITSSRHVLVLASKM